MSAARHPTCGAACRGRCGLDCSRLRALLGWGTMAWASMKAGIRGRRSARHRAGDGQSADDAAVLWCEGNLGLGNKAGYCRVMQAGREHVKGMHG